MRKKVHIILLILLARVITIGVSYYVKAVNSKVVEKGVKKDCDRRIQDGWYDDYRKLFLVISEKK